jgi:arginine repressor|tara:strand:+ start:5996 stop:6193 length:198 start_codon:yes stop_codon:yes gene_type:complete
MFISRRMKRKEAKQALFNLLEEHEGISIREVQKALEELGFVYNHVTIWRWICDDPDLQELRKSPV